MHACLYNIKIILYCCTVVQLPQCHCYIILVVTYDVATLTIHREIFSLMFGMCLRASVICAYCVYVYNMCLCVCILYMCTFNVFFLYLCVCVCIVFVWEAWFSLRWHPFAVLNVNTIILFENIDKPTDLVVASTERSVRQTLRRIYRNDRDYLYIYTIIYTLITSSVRFLSVGIFNVFYRQIRREHDSRI